MRDSFPKMLFRSYSKVDLLLGSTFPLVAGYWLNQLPTKVSLPLWVAVPLAIVFLVAFMTVLRVALECYDKANEAAEAFEDYRLSRNAIPEVFAGQPPYPPFEGVVLCLLRPSELFTYGTAVSFVYVGDDNIEILLGVGFVISIQEDRSIQAVMTKGLEAHQEKIRRIAGNDPSALKHLLVKPSVPRQYIDMYE